MITAQDYGYSDNWSISEEYPDYVVKTIVVGNVTCEILRPFLKPEERARREKEVFHEFAKAVAPLI